MDVDSPLWTLADCLAMFRIRIVGVVDIRPACRWQVPWALNVLDDRWESSSVQRLCRNHYNFLGAAQPTSIRNAPTTIRVY